MKRLICFWKGHKWDEKEIITYNPFVQMFKCARCEVYGFSHHGIIH